MKAAGWMIAGSVASAAVATAIAGREFGFDIALGIVAPLVAASVSWVLTERTWRRDPVRVTGVMLVGFVAKMVFFGAYVAVMLKLVGLHPVPFVASFTASFIGLYATEAVLMRRLFRA
jgi:hypothetical protein